MVLQPFIRWMVQSSSHDRSDKKNPPDRLLYLFLARKIKALLLLESTEIQMQKQDTGKWENCCSCKQSILSSKQVSTPKLSKCFIALQIDHRSNPSPSQKLSSILRCNRSKEKSVLKKRTGTKRGKKKKKRGKRGCPKFHNQPPRHCHRILHICMKTWPIRVDH